MYVSDEQNDFTADFFFHSLEALSFPFRNQLRWTAKKFHVVLLFLDS